MIGACQCVRPPNAVDVEIVGAGAARVREGLAAFPTCIARERSIAVGRGGEQGEGVLEVGLVLDFAWRVEAGFVEVEGAVGLSAAVG